MELTIVIDAAGILEHVVETLPELDRIRQARIAREILAGLEPCLYSLVGYLLEEAGTDMEELVEELD